MARSLTSLPVAARLAPALLALTWTLAPAGLAQGVDPSGPGLTAPDATTGDEYGMAVALSGAHAAVGAPGRSEAAPQAGAVYTVALTAGQWLPGQKLLPPSATAGDRFGLALALDGDLLLVGAPGSDVSRPDAGAAFLYRHDGAGWGLARTLRSPLPEAASRFGQTVEVRGDHLLVGAPFHDAAGLDAGAVFVFDRYGQPVDGPRILLAGGLEPGDEFGSSLACEGDTLVVGSPGRATQGSWSGGAYVFRHEYGVWHQAFDLTPTDLYPSSFFGRSVALHGTRLLVGAAGDSDAEFLSGAVYAFEHGGDGWIQVEKLKPRQPRQGAQFGFAVDLVGEDLVVGARYDPELAPNAGRTYVFHADPKGWREVRSIGEAAPGHNHWFGAALALRPGEVLVGAPHAPGSADDSGAVHVLSLQPGTPFCASDVAVGVCPCGNDAAGLGGCRNSAGDGAHLFALGSSSVQAPSLELHVSGAVPGHGAVLVCGGGSAETPVSQIHGDGLLCVAGPRALAARVVGPDGTVDWEAGSFATPVTWAAGETLAFQVVYRDVAASPCGFGLNTTNAYAIERAP